MRICTDPFTTTTDEDVFMKSNWKFELSLFQKWAIRALLNNRHALITAHTGSGKTVPAEAAIAYFISKGKKVIYTSPIKALTNQKYNEFCRKFPDITFGIFTGDNKHNPEAQVLLMTAEILRNTLFQKKMIEQGETEQEELLSFDIDIEKYNLSEIEIADATEDDWFTPYLKFAVKFGIIKKDTSNNVSPSKIINRGEAAQIIFNILENGRGLDPQILLNIIENKLNII